jgi:hypothetical protein
VELGGVRVGAGLVRVGGSSSSTLRVGGASSSVVGGGTSLLAVGFGVLELPPVGLPESDERPVGLPEPEDFPPELLAVPLLAGLPALLGRLLLPEWAWKEQPKVSPSTADNTAALATGSLTSLGMKTSSLSWRVWTDATSRLFTNGGVAPVNKVSETPARANGPLSNTSPEARVHRGVGTMFLWAGTTYRMGAHFRLDTHTASGLTVHQGRWWGHPRQFELGAKGRSDP